MEMRSTRAPARKPCTPAARFSVRSMVYMALCVALMAVCAWIAVPFTVPFTLQTVAVFLASGLLGRRRGTLAVCVYLLLGATGAPVFSGFRGGFGALLGVTGGYLVGFLPAAYFSGAIMERFGRRTLTAVAAMAGGLLLCYALGTVWFVRVYMQTNGAIGFISALSMCVFPYLIPDALKILLSAWLVQRLYPRVHA